MLRAILVVSTLLFSGCYNNLLIRGHGLTDSDAAKPSEIEACDFVDVDDIHRRFQQIKRRQRIIHGEDMIKAGVRQGRGDWEGIYKKEKNDGSRTLSDESKKMATIETLDILVNEHFDHCKNRYLQHFTKDSNRNYYLGFVEYNDQGQLRNRSQLDNIIRYFKRKFSPTNKLLTNRVAFEDELNPVSESQSHKDTSVIVIVYVHGWHHGAGFTRNGKNDDTDIQHFRHLLRLISESENASDNAREVIGIYVGWRGESIGVPGLNDLTFWGRKRVAHSIGTIGITETLIKLENLVHGSQIGASSNSNKETRNRFVLIGHSFGAAIAMSGVRNALLRDHFRHFERVPQVQNADSNGYLERERRFADLVVLLNPAFEATQLANFFDISQRYNTETQKCEGYSTDTKPTLISLTSESDNATSVAFPLGRLAVNTFEVYQSPGEVSRVRCGPSGEVQRSITHKKHMQDEQKIRDMTFSDLQKVEKEKEGSEESGWSYIPADADRTAYGHYKPFITHRLDIRYDSLLRSSVDENRGALLPLYWQNQQVDSTLCFQYVKLTQLGRSPLHSPYLNISMSGDVSGGHNDVWNIKILSFLHSMIQLSLSGGSATELVASSTPEVTQSSTAVESDSRNRGVDLNIYDSDCYPEGVIRAAATN